MKVADTSVVVAGLSSWHERHDQCREVLQERPGIVGHALVECFSVLTRLPEPFRMPAPLVAELLSANFPAPPLMFTAQQMAGFVQQLPAWGIRGGAVYDALIAATAKASAATLYTLDSRAHGTYLAAGADAQLLSP